MALTYRTADVSHGERREIVHGREKGTLGCDLERKPAQAYAVGEDAEPDGWEAQCEEGTPPEPPDRKLATAVEGRYVSERERDI